MRGIAVCGILMLATLGIASAGRAATSPFPGFPERIQEIVDNPEGRPEAERLHALFDLTWEWTMKNYPEWATYVGYPEQNNRWTDLSAEAIERREREIRLPLVALDSIDHAALAPEDQLNHDLARYQLQQRVDGQRFPDELMAISQMGGVQQNVAQMLAAMPQFDADDYEDILARLAGVPEVVNQTIALLERGLEAEVTPPRVTLRDVPQQVLNVIPEDVGQSPLLGPFQRLPEDLAESVRTALGQRAETVVGERIYPAFRKLHDFLTERYIPGCRESIALSALPDGAAWYAYNARVTTTTGLTPQEIHDIGQAEVERIRAEMEATRETAEFDGTLEEFFEFLRTDPRFFHTSREALVEEYLAIAKRADPELVKLFGTLPRLPYGVKPVPEYAEKSQTTAYYEPGSLEAGRPGYFFANTYSLDSRPRWEMEALTLHEAVPGHHLQIALAQELEALPEFRRHGGYTAFIEGWGLYSESLGYEMGFYDDPYSKMGQLTYDMWRAIRLVVDTGMHALGWSRQQAIDFFAANTPKTEHDITVEVDRYIVWPGQALAYKIGQLEIQELRQRAEETLGDGFDVRAFHDAVLGAGALPLDVLGTRIDSWIADQ
ncbi:MAG: DUF885 domain-containing protein [Thermoanaerobaculia bacterium]